jgi:glycosyltransferase involved in cell wall biosynthesis
MKVLHICEGFDPGGVVRWLADIHPFVAEQLSIDYFTINATPGVWEHEVVDGRSQIFRCEPTTSEVLFGRRVNDVLAARHYDIVHSHVFNLSGWMLRHASGLGVPIRIAHFHNTHDGRQGTPQRIVRRMVSRRLVSKYATDVVACSREALQLAPRAGGFNRVLHYGITPPVASQCSLRDEFGIPKSSPLVLHAGRFYPQNHHFLLSVFRMVHDIRQDSHLVLIGDGPLQPGIRHTAKRMGLEACVHFAGIRPDARNLLHQGNVLCFPSLHEGYAIVLVEARFAGVHVVASDLRVHREMAEGAMGVELIPLSDPERFADAVLQALDRPLSPAPHDYRLHHSALSSAERLLQLYGELGARISAHRASG